MRSRYLDLVEYNLWANQRSLEQISSLSLDQFEKDLGNSFPSIRLTLLHIWDAELLWVKRLQGESIAYFPSTKFSGDRTAIEEEMLETSREWIAWIKGAPMAAFAEDQTFHFSATDGSAYEIPGWQIITHCMNHSSYHRGQLTTMARQLGLTGLQSVDYIRYVREKQQMG